jgi:positive regulator of sigma E activity
MRTVARVQDVRAGRARLACESAPTTCQACAGGRGCALRWLARPDGATLEVPEQRPDGTRLAPGDGVILEVDDQELLRAALLAYLPPLVGLLSGPVLATQLAAAGEATAVAAAAVGLALGWGASRAWLHRSPPRYVLRAGDPP